MKNLGKMLMNSKFRIFIIISLILLGAFFVRLYRFNSPIADWHSWRQADTSSVSRNFVEKGFDILNPTYQDLSNIPSGLDNPNGYRFVEFPIYNVLQAGFFKIFNTFSLEEWGRLVSVFSSLISILTIFYILKQRGYKKAGIYASFFYAFLPFSIYYGRTILPDQTMVMASLLGICFFQNWLTKGKLSLLNYNFIFSLVFTSLAFLLKPYALFFTLPIIYLAFEKFRLNVFKNYKLFLYLILSLIPVILWRNYILRHPEGIPVSDWLFNGGDIRFKFSFFWWIFAERISKLILGYFGVGLLVLGFIYKMKRKDLYFFLSFIFSSLLYIFVMARGNVQHDYYQILIIPSLAIFLGFGADFLINVFSKERRFVSYVLFLTITLFTFSFSLFQVRDYFNINNISIVKAGEAVNRLTPKDAKIVANYNGDTSLLYQTKRSGWPSFQNGIPSLIEMGASYLVLVNPTEKDLEIGKTYKIVEKTNDYVLFNLREKP